MQIRVRINDGPGIVFERKSSGAWVDVWSGEELHVFLEKLYAKRNKEKRIAHQ
jgi:hypothetical protein